MGVLDTMRGLVGMAPATPAPVVPKISPEKWIAAVELEKGLGYATEVDRILGYYRGHSHADTRRTLTDIFPETGKHIPIVSLNVVQKIARETAQAFAGDGKFEILDTSNEPVTEAGGVSWSSVLEGANLVSKLRELDRQSVIARRVFARVTWDGARQAVRVTLFPPSKVWPKFAPGSRDCHRGAMLAELEKVVIDGSLVQAYEAWIGGETPAHPGAKPASLTVDAKGRVLSSDANDYRDDDGSPIIPWVSFSSADPDAGYWLRPEEDLLDGARAVNKGWSSIHHVGDLQGYGQWVANATGDSPDGWTERLILGPDEVAKVPKGWALSHVAQAAPLAELTAQGAAYLDSLTAMRSLPPGSVVAGTRATASGLALEVERMPLKELRADMCAIYRQPVHDLIRLARIVWNAHAPQAQRFAATSERWTPGALTGPPDPEQANRIADQEIKLGISSAVREYARREKLSLEAAAVIVAEIAAENRAARGLSMADIAPALRLPAKGAAVDVADGIDAVDAKG